MRVEICIDSVDGAVAAQEGGADRVELCDNLFEGGTTPSAGCIKVARQKLRIGFQVMIRARGGDFHYSAREVEVMKEDIRMAKELGAEHAWLPLLHRIQAAAEWPSPADLAARKAFLPFSTHVVELVQLIVAQEETFRSLKVYHCPMAPKPGLWFQAQGPLRNP